MIIYRPIATLLSNAQFLKVYNNFDPGVKITFRFKQCYFCWMLAFLSFLAHLTSFIMDVNNTFVVLGNFIELLQGVFLFTIFIWYKFEPVKKNIKTSVRTLKRNFSREPKTPTSASNGGMPSNNMDPEQRTVEETELEPLNLSTARQYST